MIIYLKNNPETMFALKQELSVKEIKKQSETYEKVTSRSRNTFAIAASCSPKEVLRKINRINIDMINI